MVNLQVLKAISHRLHKVLKLEWMELMMLDMKEHLGIEQDTIMPTEAEQIHQ